MPVTRDKASGTITGPEWMLKPIIGYLAMLSCSQTMYIRCKAVPHLSVENYCPACLAREAMDDLEQEGTK